jgi:LuxR family maltose regulon positive regulatory protein
MPANIKILNSKLLPPRPSDSIIRERLYPLLDEIPKNRLTTVVAGAGYGKTTLIAQTGRYLGLNIAWYRLDKSDGDFTTFLNFLIAGARKYYPDLGEETLQRVEEAGTLSRAHEAILTIFLSEMEKFVKEKLIFVLDDYHSIQDSQEINEALKFLLEHLPPLVHLIIISRTVPGLVLSRLRAQREILEITEADLVFTIPEIQQLYSSLFDLSLQSDDLKTLHQKTDGWISGLILFYHAIRGKGPEAVKTLLSNLKGSLRIISSYLEENVYHLLPEPTMDFLIKTSILSRLSVEFCNRLLKIDTSRGILRDLEENHLFTFPFDETRQWFYYHHLFQEFLETKLHQELDTSVIRNLHNDAAVLWEEYGEAEEALRHYLEAEQFDHASRLLKRQGSRLLKEGRLKLLDSYLQRIPRSYFDNEPWLQYTKACVLEFFGKTQEAIQAYQKAHKVFSDQKASKGVGMCLNALGYTYYLIGDFLRAEKRLKELLNQVKGNPHLSINILGHLIFIASHLGKMTIADRYYSKGLSLLHGSREKDLFAWLFLFQGFRYGCSGDFAKALQFGKQTEEICQNLGHNHLLTLDYHLISWSCYYSGLFSKGMDTAAKGLDLARKRGVRDISHGWLLIDTCLNATALEKIPEAIEGGKAGLRVCQDLGSRWSQAWAYHALQGAYEKSGDPISAEQCARMALEVIGGLMLPLDEGVMKWGLARLLLGRGQPEEARLLLEDAEKNLKHSLANLSRVYLSQARLFWEQKQKEPAMGKLLAGLELCESKQVDVWVVSEKHWIIPLLVEAYAQGKMQDYVQKILNQIGLRALGELKILQESKDSRIQRAAFNISNEIKKGPPPALRVQLLGEFKLFRGDAEIPAAKWKSKNAQMLFKFLVYKRTHGYLTKDILMELLWPEEDPQKTANRLRVALTSLRKTLEPEIARGTPSSYLLRQGDSYKLSMGDRGRVDVDEFRIDLKLAGEEKDTERSISHCLHAETIYQGDFLEEDLHVPWCAEERERLKEEYLALLVRIMEHYENRGDYQRCIDCAGKYLKKDKFAENIYQQLMKYYSLVGNKGMVARTFERCKENIVRELDSPLSEETKALYQELISP